MNSQIVIKKWKFICTKLEIHKHMKNQQITTLNCTIAFNLHMESQGDKQQEILIFNSHNQLKL
ncbi:hypothetical protein pb186bvf_019037 [Paramecium bursaria]